ncbi:protein of unknown function [Pararobbsia alpina]
MCLDSFYACVHLRYRFSRVRFDSVNARIHPCLDGLDLCFKFLSGNAGHSCVSTSSIE